MNYHNLFYALNLVGVAVFAVSGVLAVARKGLDIFGVLVVATLTAIGGGTMRDLLLDRNPIFWIDDPAYLIVITITTFFTIIYLRFCPPPGKALVIADALGLGLFGIAGAQIAEANHLSPLLIIVMATITGTAGGILRDVLTAEIPLILRQDIYATAVIVGTGCYLLAEYFALERPIAFLIGSITIVLLRLLAIFRGIRVPIFHLP